MIYDNSSVRRRDRLLEESEALDLLRQAEYGVLSLYDPENGPYGIPVNYVWDGKDSLYIHCAPEGRKLRILEAYPRVSFCIAGHTHVFPKMFTTAYQSIIAQGTASVVDSAEEKHTGLELLIDKYSPRQRDIGLKYIEKSFHRTSLIRFDIETLSGKCKKIKKPIE